MKNFIDELMEGVYVENVRSHFDCSTKTAEHALKLATDKGLMTSEVELALDSGQVIARYFKEDGIPGKIKYYTYQEVCVCGADTPLDTATSDGYDEFVVLQTSKLRKLLKFYAVSADSAHEFITHFSTQL